MCTQDTECTPFTVIFLLSLTTQFNTFKLIAYLVLLY